MKVISAVVLLSLCLSACEKSETIISSVGKNSVAMVENHGVISNSDRRDIQVNLDNSDYNNQVIVSGDNNTVISQSSHGKNSNNVVINGDNQIVINNGVVTMNGRKQKQEGIIIHLTGEKQELPFYNSATLNINSSIGIIQHCSDKPRLIVDKAIAPYIDSQKLSRGEIQFKSGKYTIQGEEDINAELYTSPINSIELGGLSDITLTCLNNVLSTIKQTGHGDVILSNVESKKLTLIDSGMGNITIKSSHIDALDVQKDSMGNLKVLSPIELLTINNSGMGNVTISAAKQSDITNSGMGNIHVSGKTHVLGLENSGMGKIKLD